MRVLWISCLLIGSITCGPVGKGYGSNSADMSSMHQPFGYGYGTGYDSSAPYGSYGAYVGDSSSGFVAALRDENLSAGSANSYGNSDENDEPVFSDVSDLEPVYSFSSRSSYQRGRAVFAQTRYTPGEPVPPVQAVSRRISKTSSMQSSPAKAPTKGSF